MSRSPITRHLATRHLATRHLATRHLAALSIVGLLGAILPSLSTPAAALEPAMTAENVHRKALVVTQDAKLYDSASGDAGKSTEFMQLYFMLQGEMSGRIPVTLEPNETEPAGWLAKEDIAEWNTLQMINFEPQSGRQLVKIFDSAACAQDFSAAGKAGGCEELGSEPSRTGKTRDDYALLIPVVDRERDNYKGGFVRVTAGDSPVVTPQTGDDAAGQATGSSGLGYDLVLVVDSTASMQRWFKPTTEVLDSFVRSIQNEIGGGELQKPFRVGLLFYRDRKNFPDCELGYIARWETELTDRIESVTSVLASAREATCGSDEIEEAVFDGLSRAVQDPKWADGVFKVVLLVGDAPPHLPSNRTKNPLALDVDLIIQQAQERKIRFLALKIGTSGTEEFEALALRGPDSIQGRFKAIEPNPSEYKQQLSTALREEWNLLTKANRAVQAGVSGAQLAQDPSLARQLDIDAYDLPIIIANLPPGSAGTAPPEFVEGWVPKYVEKQLALGEFVFMTKNGTLTLANIVDTIALAAESGVADGPDAFIQNLRTSLAAMLSVPPDELFRSGESLDSMLRKARTLPFKTTVLSFTAAEINSWSPADFERLNKILSEKTKLLREFAQKPGNIRLFGKSPHLYVPRDLFP